MLSACLFQNSARSQLQAPAVSAHNVTRIIIKDEKGKVMLEIPATVGVIGVLLVPWLAALGAIAALVAKCRIVVERRE